MTILLILLVLFVACFFYTYWYDSDLAFVGSVFSGVILFVALIALPVNRMAVQAKIAGFHALGATAITAREADSGMEMAAYQMKVAEANQWLAGIKYWNGTMFDIWTPDEVEDLEPIH